MITSDQPEPKGSIPRVEPDPASHPGPNQIEPGDSSRAVAVPSGIWPTVSVAADPRQSLYDPGPGIDLEVVNELLTVALDQAGRYELIAQPEGHIGASPAFPLGNLGTADVPTALPSEVPTISSAVIPATRPEIEAWSPSFTNLPKIGLNQAPFSGQKEPILAGSSSSELEALGSQAPLWFSDPGHLPPWADDTWKSLENPTSNVQTSGVARTDKLTDHYFNHNFRGLSAHAPPAYVGPIAVEKIRADFPILQTTVEGGQPLIWFDNAATTQKPQVVIDRLVRYYQEENSNVHRGAHTLATKATEAYEEARRKVASFIGAPAPENIVFVRGTTEGVNLIAQAFVSPRLGPGDEIILTELEHHANIVPWQILAQQKKAHIKVLPIDDQGQLIVSHLARLISPRTRVVSLAHVSNALGTVTELEEVIALAKGHGIPVVVDAAQSVPHLPIDAKTLGADFIVFSGHKIYGPTGIGAVYGTKEALDEAQPWQGGGNMIADVTFERTLYREPPVKFEAGTPNIAGAVGLGAALDYVGALGIDRVAIYEESLLRYLAGQLLTVPGLKIIGTPVHRAGSVSFVLADRSVADVGAHLARHGLAVRAGHHCAQPAVRHFGLEGTVRASPAFYNTPAEVDRFVDVLGLLV